GDVSLIAGAATRGREAVVIGGGLLGLEAAYGLARAGAQVTVVHLMDRLMERQLDARAAALLKSAMEQKGITVLPRAAPAALRGMRRIGAGGPADRRTVEADLVVVAIGIRPNVELARTAGLDIGRGVIVDDGLRTSNADIFAIGECAEHRGTCY